jgi:DNA-binding Xre family transcriptional regulator
MTTLRDVWIEKGMNSTEVAAQAHISVPTLYKLNRKEKGVAIGIVQRVCAVLGLSLDEYVTLEVCPMADRYREKKK